MADGPVHHLAADDHAVDVAPDHGFVVVGYVDPEGRVWHHTEFGAAVDGGWEVDDLVPLWVRQADG